MLDLKRKKRNSKLYILAGVPHRVQLVNKDPGRNTKGPTVNLGRMRLATIKKKNISNLVRMSMKKEKREGWGKSPSFSSEGRKS